MSGYQITWPWARPFDESGVQIGRDTGVLPVGIDGREYMLDTRSGRYRRQSVDVLRTRQNQSPNENLLLEPEVWRSSVESWHQGGGQTRKDRDDSLPYRYYSSKNINVWEKWGLSLLHRADLLDEYVGESPLVFAFPGHLVVSTSSTLYVYTALTGGSATSYAAPGAILSAASDGQSLYVLCADDTVYKVEVSTGVFTAHAALPVSTDSRMVDYVKGFLIAAVGPDLYDISSGVADATTKFYTAPLSGHTWLAATDGLAAGYLLGGQGDKWFVYWVTVRDDASTLNPPVVAAPLPEGEIGYSLGSYLGFVLVGTDRGVRFCTPAGDNTLTYGRLILTDSPVVDFEGQDRFVWFGIGGNPRDTEEALRQPEAGLARMDLSVFTAPLTPAFAADLVAHQSGADVPGTAQGVTTFQDKRVFTTEDAVFFESSEFAADGWLQEGVFNQQVRDKKIPLYGSVSCEPLPGGQIDVSFSADTAAAVSPQIVLQAVGSVSSGNIDLGGVRFEGLVVEYALEATTDRLGTPRLTRMEFRSVPVVGRAHEWQVPVIITEEQDYLNVTTGRDLREDVEHLISLVETGRLFTYREGGQEHECYSPGYEWFPMMMSSDGRDWQGTMILRIRSIR